MNTRTIEKSSFLLVLAEMRTFSFSSIRMYLLLSNTLSNDQAFSWLAIKLAIPCFRLTSKWA